MASATLHIDLTALQANWRALNRGSETAAVVKANAYGLGATKVAETLAAAGARRFFVAIAEEGVALRDHLGPGPEIFVFAGHMAGDAARIRSHQLTPLLNSAEQVARHLEACPGLPFGIQLDSGMNRLGMEEVEWRAVAPAALSHGPKLVMSHLACADDPDEAMNAAQLETFLAMTAGIDLPRSIAATGGILLGEAYHLDLTRPGIGLYGGLPFAQAQPVVRLSLPVVQTRTVAPGEAVGYGRAWIAQTPSRIATLSAGYADGLIRAMGGRARLWADDTPCPLAGRVSMDLLTVDVTHLSEVPDHLDILGPHQSVDTLAETAGTIGYEILTALGARYERRYSGGTS